LAAQEEKMSKVKVAVVGATGLAGQQFLVALAGHPRFQVVRLAASERSAGKTYAEAIRDSAGATRWYCNEPLPEELARLPVVDAASLDLDGIDCVFTAVEADPARVLEPRYAEKVPVISTASAFRYDDDVPIFIPAVNPAHAGLIDVQRKRRGWKGFITPIPNCTATGLVMSLAPLQAAFGLRRVIMTSLQACSGAGRSPGVMGLDIIDNVIPFIPKEEEKVEKETRKILGRLTGDTIAPLDVAVSCTCTRVPVLEGHTEAVFVSLARGATPKEAAAAMTEFGASFVARGYPTAPRRLVVVREDPYRPQPRLDRDEESGMATVVGRLRADPVLENGLKYVLVSHNTKMGAARGAVLTAEILQDAGYIK
jgi:aspartate-semialdehyde dehydrogenase